MAIEEKEQQETLLKDLIEKIEKDPLPTNIFTIEDTDPLVLLGKLNEVIAILKSLQALISSSDSKATEALTKALDAVIKAGEALVTAQEAKTTAETLGNEAKTTAENAVNIANQAQDKADTADSTAIEAMADASDAISKANEALQKANEALSHVVTGLGTKVYDNHGQLMGTTKFAGHNGINVDMAENDPETFDIRLDNTITTKIDESNALSQSNKTSIEALTPRVSANEQDIVELTNMLSATEELAQQATEALTNKLDKKTGGKMEAQMSFASENAIPEKNDLEFIAGINSFLNGGGLHYIRTSDLANNIGVNDKIPVFALEEYDCDKCYDAGLYQISHGKGCPSRLQYGSLLVLTYRKNKGNTTPDYAVQLFIPKGDDSTSPNTLFWRSSTAYSWNAWQSHSPATPVFENFSNNKNAKIIKIYDNFVLIMGWNYSYSGGNGWKTITLPTPVPWTLSGNGNKLYNILFNFNYDHGDHVTHLIRNKTSTSFEIYLRKSATYTFTLIGVV